ncbi:unnamed protein product [Clonostachys chloroleuca]|uniref:Xylanolytic transcriptional activator regulatory domain-containing protein n=1 Tax=Clonostachys chloroleuca TaxID=1926264 RepID=A0AA35MDB6_9HYPO|nr:unnamed protein product [Clonostachys chloroleuca]
MAASQPTWGNNLLILASGSSKDGPEKPRGTSTNSKWTTNTDHIFFGVSSHLAAITSPTLPLTNSHSETLGSEPSAGWISGSLVSTAQIAGPPDISIATRLFAVFSRSVHVWYPIMKDESLRSLLLCCNTEALDPCLDQKQELFYLVLAISSLLTKRAEPSMSFTPAAYFNTAISNADTNCDHSSGPSTLHMMQRSLLICIYLLLSPGSGDIWRNLGFAIRLHFDMSHGRSENMYLDEGHHTMLARTLYCIEGNVTTAFGRPTVLAIGDKLHYELTLPACDTVNEGISIQFYRISTIKMQLQSLLSAATVQHNPARLKDRCQAIQTELLEWHQHWKTDFVPAITSEVHGWGDAVQYLDAWGTLQYNASMLMISRFCPEAIESVFDTAREVVSCSVILVRHSQRSFCAIPDNEARYKVPVFPTDWTMSHILFAAVLQMLSSGKQGAADRTAWQRTMRSCLTTLALMEADPANLSMGFSGIIEEMCNRNEEHT